MLKGHIHAGFGLGLLASLSTGLAYAQVASSRGPQPAGPPREVVEPDRSERPVLSPLARTLLGAGVRPPRRNRPGPIVAPGGGRRAPGSCLIDFDDETTLDWYPDDARYTFADEYAQWCGDHIVSYTQPLAYGHFHLSYEDGAVADCLPLFFGEFCESISPAEEPRELAFHWSDQWIRLKLEDLDAVGSGVLPFTLHTIRIQGAPARVCYKPASTTDGPWIVDQPDPEDEGPATPGVSYCWEALPPGWWDLSEHVVDVSEVNIRPAGQMFPTIDDIEIGWE